MARLIDFDDIKQRFPIMDVVRLLEIEVAPSGDKFRGKCHYCDDKRSFVVTPTPQDKPWGLAGCFACGKKNLSVIQLVMDFKGFNNPRLAAEYILERLGNGTVNSTVPAASKSTVPPRKSTVPESESRKATAATSEETAKKLKLEGILARCDPEHEAVACLGFSTEFAKQYQIGYLDGQGFVGKSVVVPFRDENGEIICLIGLIECKLPPDCKGNVLPFAKKSA